MDMDSEKIEAPLKDILSATDEPIQVGDLEMTRSISSKRDYIVKYNGSVVSIVSDVVHNIDISLLLDAYQHIKSKGESDIEVGQSVNGWKKVDTSGAIVKYRSQNTGLEIDIKENNQSFVLTVPTELPNTGTYVCNDFDVLLLQLRYYLQLVSAFDAEYRMVRRDTVVKELKKVPGVGDTLVDRFIKKQCYRWEDVLSNIHVIAHNHIDDAKQYINEQMETDNELASSDELRSLMQQKVVEEI